MFLVLSVIAIIAIETNMNVKQSSSDSKLLLANIEALASSGESGSGLRLFTVCSRKSGAKFCTDKRGYRKWAIDVHLSITNVPGSSVECSECPDDDFDYED